MNSLRAVSRYAAVLAFVCGFRFDCFASAYLADCGLADAVPKEQRRNITVDGVQMPLGVVPLGWPSATVLAHLAAILAAESLGIHTDMMPPESASRAALRRIAGCEAVSSPVCELRPASTSHVAVEAWDAEVDTDLLSAALGNLMPRDLGSVGYQGFQSIFLTMATHARADGGGAALDFYRSFNASWHTPSRYFHKYTDIGMQGLLPCSATKSYRQAEIDQYVAVSGDTGGVEVVNGTRVARCVDGLWWLAPACRASPELCVPVIDSGDGWVIGMMMQRAAVHNMPLALAVATWAAYIEIPRSYKVLFAWWKPDTTFLDLSPAKLGFPEYDEEQWGEGNRATECKPSTCRKWGHSQVFAEEMRLRKMLESLRISLAEMERMLASARHGLTEAEIACEWLKANSARWKAWTPSETTCFTGWGLADRFGQFVANSSEAVTCQRCPGGRYSRSIRGNTHVCELCPPGGHQQTSGQAECHPCSPGTFADGFGHKTCHTCARGTASAQNGSVSCDVCWPGKFQPSVGMSTCVPCAAGGFQAGVGATVCETCQLGESSSGSAAACQPCAAGSVASDLGSSACKECAAGRFAASIGLSRCSACPVGSFANASGASACAPCGGGAPLWTTSRHVAQGEWASTDAAMSEADCGCAPGARLDEGRCVACREEGVECPGRGDVLILPGYYSAASLSVFKCRSAERCPGGQPGSTCASGRQGVACARCPAGSRSGAGGRCVPCEPWSGAPAAVGCACAVLGCFLLYHSFDGGQPNLFALLLGACGSLLVALLQQLSALGRFGVALREPLRSFLGGLQIVAFDLGEVLMLSCILPVSPLADFGAMLSLILSSVLVLLAIHVFVVVFHHNSKFSLRRPVLISAAGPMVMTLFTPLVVVATRPFQCSLNPNGKWTVLAYEDVVCWSDDEGRHIGMLIVGLAGFAISGLFFAKVIVIVRRFPLAVRTADAGFMQRFGVFFRRFTPGAYWYSVVFLLRGMLVSLIPIIPNVASQVYAFSLVTACSFVVVVGCRPWRSDLLNIADSTFSAVFLLFVVAVALEAKISDVYGVACLGIASIGLALSCCAAVLLAAAGKRLGIMGKRFDFFLCFCQPEAGAFARWLQLDLADRPQVTNDICVEADVLESLDNLLMIIAGDVERFLVLGTLGVFARPWCIGELAAAHRDRLRSDLIALPGFQLPDATLGHRLAEDVSADLCLREVGIHVGLVREALVALSAKTPILVPVEMNVATMSGITAALLGVHDSGAMRPAPADGAVVILADTTNAQAGVVAHLVRAMLGSCAELRIAGLPMVLPVLEEMPARADKALVLVTEGCFRQRAFVQHILTASDRMMHMIPILSEVDVHVPCRSDLEAWTQDLPKMARPAGHIVDVILELFSDIALVVDAKHATGGVLDTVRDAIARRLAGTPLSRQTRLVPRSSFFPIVAS